MHRPATLFRTFLRSEPVVAVAATVVVGGVGIWVTPKAIEAMTPDPPPLGEVRVEGDTPEDRAALIDGLRRLLEGSYAFVTSRDADADGPASLLLWQSDQNARGTLNPDEALLVVHSGLLQTITAAYIDAPPSEKRLDVASMSQPDALRRLRTLGSVRTSVIATGVTALSIAPRRAAPGEADLALTLTWAPNNDDAPDAAGPSRTTLHVRLRLVEGVER